MKRHNDHKISEILEQMVEQPKIKSGYYRVSIEEAWSELMGKTIQSYTQSIQFNKGLLILRISSAPLKQELAMGKEKIIRLLNERIGRRLIEDILIK